MKQKIMSAQRKAVERALGLFVDQCRHCCCSGPEENEAPATPGWSKGTSVVSSGCEKLDAESCCVSIPPELTPQALRLPGRAQLPCQCFCFLLTMARFPSKERGHGRQLPAPRGREPWGGSRMSREAPRASRGSPHGSLSGHSHGPGQPKTRLGDVVGARLQEPAGLGVVRMGRGSVRRSVREGPRGQSPAGGGGKQPPGPARPPGGALLPAESACGGYRGALPCLALICPVLPSPALPGLSSTARPCPLCPALPCLLCSTRPCPTLPVAAPVPRIPGREWGTCGAAARPWSWDRWQTAPPRGERPPLQVLPGVLPAESPWEEGAARRPVQARCLLPLAEGSVCHNPSAAEPSCRSCCPRTPQHGGIHPMAQP